VVATAAIISLQTWGQSRTTANEAAVVYAFEPAAAAFFGYFWLGEAMTARGWLGGLLLISGMIVSQWNSEAGPPPRSPPSDDVPPPIRCRKLNCPSWRRNGRCASCW
jgi:drug/metabolite transporter (DMT)-like permease